MPSHSVSGHRSDDALDGGGLGFMTAYHHPEKPHFMEFITTANLPQGKLLLEEGHNKDL